MGKQRSVIDGLCSWASGGVLQTASAHGQAAECYTYRRPLLMGKQRSVTDGSAHGQAAECYTYRRPLLMGKRTW